MSLYIPHTWSWFCCCLFVVIVTTIIMIGQGRKFFYFDRAKKRFSMMNLEFPVNRCYMYFIFRQINKLPNGESSIVHSSLRGQLYVDFIYMFGTYIGVGLLCMAAACRYSEWVGDFFAVLAWLQFLAWALDITENFYLLSQIKKPVMPTPFLFACYRLLEILKWGLAGGGFLLSLGFLLFYHFHH